MPIVIYKTSVSPPARAVLMTVKLLGLEVETKEVNLPTREQFNPEYLVKNPLHTVPLLENDGFVLAESHAIITYLVSEYGGEKHSNLYPKDNKTRAIIDQRLYFDSSILFPRFKPVVYSLVKKRHISEQQVNDIKEAYGFLEKYLENDPYVAGDRVTLADISCVATVSSLNSMVAVDKKFQKVHEWWSKLQKEEWYRENVAGVKLFDGFIRQFLG